MNVAVSARRLRLDATCNKCRKARSASDSSSRYGRNVVCTWQRHRFASSADMLESVGLLLLGLLFAVLDCWCCFPTCPHPRA